MNVATDKVQDHDKQLIDLASTISKLMKDLKRVDSQLEGGVDGQGRPGGRLGGVPWDLLTSAMTFFHDRNDNDRDLITSRAEQDDQISSMNIIDNNLTLVGSMSSERTF